MKEEEKYGRMFDNRTMKTLRWYNEEQYNERLADSFKEEFSTTLGIMGIRPQNLGYELNKGVKMATKSKLTIFIEEEVESKIGRQDISKIVKDVLSESRVSNLIEDNVKDALYDTIEDTVEESIEGLVSETADKFDIDSKVDETISNIITAEDIEESIQETVGELIEDINIEQILLEAIRSKISRLLD